MYEQMKKNTVDSSNQLMKSEYVRICNPEGKGIRVMFAGNSITLHGVKEEIGWLNEWGMAASEREKDYVHRLMKKILETDADASYCICQVSEWERNYKNGRNIHYLYNEARDFNADIIIARFIENCPINEFDAEVFKKEYGEFIQYLKGDREAKVVLTSSFWKHPGDTGIYEISGEKNYSFVTLGDLGERNDMKAKNLFSHDGVANHPGDEGMKVIADRIWKTLDL